MKTNWMKIINKGPTRWPVNGLVWDCVFDNVWNFVNMQHYNEIYLQIKNQTYEDLNEHNVA